MARRSRIRARRKGVVARWLALAALGAFALTVSSPAAASVTLGQLAPAPTATTTGIDFMQASVSSGNSYRVPEKGTITSWSHNAAAGANQMLTMKVFRKFAEPNFYKVVGLDARGPLDAGLLNIFAVSIPVQPGDIIGLQAPSGPVASLFSAAPGDGYLFRSGNVDLGDAAGFSGPSTGARVNLSAQFVPSNTFTVDATTLNRKKGTATLDLTLPNPGELSASGTGANVAFTAVSKTVAAGPAQLLIKAKGRKRRTLNRTGKVKLNVAITYTPANGDPATQSAKVTLKKN